VRDKSIVDGILPKKKKIKLLNSGKLSAKYSLGTTLLEFKWRMV